MQNELANRAMNHLFQLQLKVFPISIGLKKLL
jgi:hypothetical protein